MKASVSPPGRPKRLMFICVLSGVRGTRSVRAKKLRPVKIGRFGNKKCAPMSEYRLSTSLRCGMSGNGFAANEAVSCSGLTGSVGLCAAFLYRGGIRADRLVSDRLGLHYVDRCRARQCYVGFADGMLGVDMYCDAMLG